MNRAILIPVICGVLAGCERAGGIVATQEPSFTDDQCVSDCYTPPPVYYKYGSNVDIEEQYNSSGAYHEAEAWSWSRGLSGYVATSRVDAVTYRYYDCRTKSEYERKSATATGTGEAKVYFRFTYGSNVPDWGWQVVGTHTFTMQPGVGGGGTYTTEASQCGESGLW